MTARRTQAAGVAAGVMLTVSAALAMTPAQSDRRLPTQRTSPPATVQRGPYTSVQVNVTQFGNNIVGDAANEPSIAIDPNDPNRIVIGWRQFDTVESDFREAGWAYSHDGGQTWTFPGVLQENVFRSDPVLAADADGNFYYYSLTASSPYTCQMFKSIDGGLSWEGPIDAYGGDKAWMAIDRTGGVGHGNIYCAWDYAGCCGDDWFTRSIDGGGSYMSPMEIPLRPSWGTVAIGPDGAVYVAGRKSYSYSQFVCTKSFTVQDPGETPEFEFATQIELGGALQFNIGYGPNPCGLLGQVWAACDDSGGPTHGYVYLLCTVDPPAPVTDPHDVMFTRSTDGGETWSSPLRVNHDPPDPGSWQWFGTMSVAPNGRIDVIWNDTRNFDNYRWSEVFYAYSTDGGESFSGSAPITPAFDSHVGWPQQEKLGDYYHMISDDVGACLAYAATFNGEQDIYFLRLGDCNGNGVHDGIDIANGTASDVNANGMPDECDGVGDVNCDGLINTFDIDPFVLALIDADAYATAYPHCDIRRADCNGDDDVNMFDIDFFVELITSD